jgi:hypothetical protein
LDFMAAHPQPKDVRNVRMIHGSDGYTFAFDRGAPPIDRIAPSP